MPSAEITAQSADLARYSVTPTDIQSVQKEINNNKCDDRMVRQYIQATGGDLKAVSLVATQNAYTWNLTCPINDSLSLCYNSSVLLFFHRLLSACKPLWNGGRKCTQS